MNRSMSGPVCFLLMIAVSIWLVVLANERPKYHCVTYTLHRDYADPLLGIPDSGAHLECSRSEPDK